MERAGLSTSIALIVLLCAARSGQATAQARAGRHPTVMATGTVGYFTYKSKLATNNDTGLSYDYAAGIFAGDDRNIGALLRGASYAAPFALANAKITHGEQHFVFNYRTGFAYFGAAIGTQTIKFELGGTTRLDAHATTLGGNVGLLLDINRQSGFLFDALVSKPMKTQEAEERPVTLGLRIGTEACVSFNLLKKNMFVLFGVRYVSQDVKVNGQGGAETLTAPTFGVRLAL